MTVAEVPVTVAFRAPPEYTRYSLMPLASVDAVQDTLIEVVDCAVAPTPVGVDGAVVSGSESVVADAVALFAETLPALSTATTEKL